VEQARVAVLLLLRAELLEVVHLEQVLVEVPEAPAELLVGPLEADLAVPVEAAVAARTRSSIPWMARSPTRRLLAQSPTT
jgi:hypothetical protein